MIIVLKQPAKKDDITRITEEVKKLGLKTSVVTGSEQTIIGLIGDTTIIDPKKFEVDEAVDHVMRVSEPYKLANREFHPSDTIVDVNGVKIGGGNICYIAGPCSVENKEQILEVARAVKKSGANILRGGAFKPRTSPYAFQGMGEVALNLLLEAKKETGLPICTELMDAEYIPLFNEKVDLVQIGARNMQNYSLLKKVGSEIKKPILYEKSHFCIRSSPGCSLSGRRGDKNRRIPS